MTDSISNWLRENQCGDDGKQKSALPEHQGIPFSRWRNTILPAEHAGEEGWQLFFSERSPLDGRSPMAFW
jgi:hypothetical protein